MGPTTAPAIQAFDEDPGGVLEVVAVAVVEVTVDETLVDEVCVEGMSRYIVKADH